MKTRIRLLIAAWFTVVLVGVPACSTSSTTPARIATSDDISIPLEDFTLTERNGKKVSKSDLHGKVWIASFVFTRCTGPCPAVTATMARLQSELADEPNLRLVTFTVDPARDDPAELRKYAEHFRADKDRWLFLTGDENELHRLLKEGFKIPVARNVKAATPGDEFDHSTRLVVVDRHGNIRGYYQGVADTTQHGSDAALEADLKKLKAKVADLLRETR
jgi:protein SCO1/2